MKALFPSKWEEFLLENPEYKGSRKRKKSSGVKRSQIVYDCSTCELEKTCKNPRIQMFGSGKKGILVVGLCPGIEEDSCGIPFVGRSGKLLASTLKEFEIDLDKDCRRTNLVRCLSRTAPSDTQIRCCEQYLEKDILEAKPKVIVCLGVEAVRGVLKDWSMRKMSMDQVNGRVFPSRIHRSWVVCCYHPSFILRSEGKRISDWGRLGKYSPSQKSLFKNTLRLILEALIKPFPNYLDEMGDHRILRSVEEVRSVLAELGSLTDPVSFDFETSSLSPFAEGAEILSVSLSKEIGSADFIPFNLLDESGNSFFTERERVELFELFTKFVQSPVPKVVQNNNMEDVWCRVFFNCAINNLISDTMVTEHVLSCRGGTTGLGFQSFFIDGSTYKKEVNAAKLRDESIEKTCRYNCLDARYTLKAHLTQENRFIGRTREFNALITRCLQTLSEMKYRGVRIDIKLLDSFHKDYSLKLDRCLENLKANSGVVSFGKGKKEFNINSDLHIGKVLFDFFQEENCGKTKTGHRTVSSEVLNTILIRTKNPEVISFLTSLLEYRKAFSFLKKVREYRRLTDSDGYLHPSFNMSVARTYRSSASDPNIQNPFRRNPELYKFRACIIPRPGRIFLEPDYTGLEVVVIGMVSGDKVLGQQIKDGVDPHRRWALKIFRLSEVDSTQRYLGKNRFVFPSFYGSVSSSIARSFPEIPSEHIDRVWKEFWSEYQGVREWQGKTMDFYDAHGYIEGVTGFIRPGPLDTEKIYNTPIQGPAFHLALDALDRCNKEMNQRLESFPVVEVHDSLLFDVKPSEAEDVIEITNRHMLSKRFDWQRDLPLRNSWGIGENWYNMSKLF